jgi:hypothetical protein
MTPELARRIVALHEHPLFSAQGAAVGWTRDAEAVARELGVSPAPRQILALPPGYAPTHQSLSTVLHAAAGLPQTGVIPGPVTEQPHSALLSGIASLLGSAVEWNSPIAAKGGEGFRISVELAHSMCSIDALFVPAERFDPWSATVSRGPLLQALSRTDLLEEFDNHQAASFRRSFPYPEKLTYEDGQPVTNSMSVMLHWPTASTSYLFLAIMEKYLGLVAPENGESPGLPGTSEIKEALDQAEAVLARVREAFFPYTRDAYLEAQAVLLRSRIPDPVHMECPGAPDESAPASRRRRIA